MLTYFTTQLVVALTVLAAWIGPADFYQVFLNRVLAAAAPSPDAIAIRIIPNPEHFSSADWYKANIKSQGSPQAVIIDGYDAIRDGRTVYVNAANIDLANNKFYNNIYLLSFNQNAEAVTADIFGQLLSQWKFNANITDQGLKNKIRNDTKRLSDLAKIKMALQSHKASRGAYPKLVSGSYLAGKSLSVWPSWQAALGAELNLGMPPDPINRLGACPAGYDAKTCWNQTEKKFATDLNQPVFPVGSRVYFYSVDAKGENIKLCGQLETNFANIAAFNCFVDQLPNSAPIISGSNLSGWPTQKFTGFAGVSDPDQDNLSYSLDLVEPVDASRWLNEYLWQWEAGANGFTVKNSSVPGQIIISAAKAGKAAPSGAYKVRLTLNDGKNQPNSQVSQIIEVKINPYPMELGSQADDLVIGENKNYALSGLDSSRQPIASLRLRNFTLNGSAVDMAAHGFSLNGMNLAVNFTAEQKLGLYKADVYSVDPTTGNEVNSFFQINLINHPPAISGFTAKYADNAEQAYTISRPFIIDNEEPATIRVGASDPDPGHIVKYELLDNAELAINRDSGIISGLERLNYHELADKAFNIKVRAFDQYCAQSNSVACSTTANFNLTVKKYCSLSNPLSTKEISLLPEPYKINASGQKLNLGSSLSDCSSVGNSRVDIKYTGQGRSQAIVFVLDLSKSMDANVNGAPAIQQLKSVLTANDGVLKKLYDVGSRLTAGYSLKVGLVGYNSGVYPYSPVNIADSGELANLKNQVNNYSTNYETNTLAALNKAEELLRSVTGANVDKYVILMSDGAPAVTMNASSGTCCVSLPVYPPPSCSCGGAYPNCAPWPVCPEGQTADSCTSCYAPQCECGGSWPNCYYPTCPCGNSGCGCLPDNCHSSFNRKSLIKIALDKIFGLRPALAETEQTQCLSYNSCGSCGANQYNACCSSSITYNCDISGDIDVEARTIKNSGINFYSIYYNTTGQSGAEQKMCQWSSSNGANCGNGSYFFSGTDISLMFERVLSGIVNKPKNVKLEAAAVVDSQPYAITNTDRAVNFDAGLSCGLAQLGVTYSGAGYLEFSGLKFNYCPAKLHP